MRRISVIATAAAMVVAVTGLAGGQASASVQSLGTCVTHYGNTVAWMDCKGGTQASWVRLGYNCGIPPATVNRLTQWYVLAAGGKGTVSARCALPMNRAWYNVRVY